VSRRSRSAVAKVDGLEEEASDKIASLIGLKEASLYRHRELDLSSRSRLGLISLCRTRETRVRRCDW